MSLKAFYKFILYCLLVCGIILHGNKKGSLRISSENLAHDELGDTDDRSTNNKCKNSEKVSRSEVVVEVMEVTEESTLYTASIVRGDLIC